MELRRVFTGWLEKNTFNMLDRYGWMGGFC